MRRVVRDTNVVVNALLFRGATSGLHAIWKRGTLTLAVSDRTLAELAVCVRPATPYRLTPISAMFA